jgi:hypothetical protein
MDDVSIEIDGFSGLFVEHVIVDPLGAWPMITRVRPGELFPHLSLQI